MSQYFNAIVAMSGGIDSSVAAQLLKNQKFHLLGFFLHFWKDNNLAGQAVENKCCSIADLIDARRVCNKLGIPLYTLNFKDVFKKYVVDYFLNEYKCGNTPNPCIHCNKLVKLGLLIQKAKELGFNYVVSGHYAKLKKINNKYKLFKAKDKTRDQSYFLYSLSQEQLKYLLFPLGDLTKHKVRQIAVKFQLPITEKKESREICFISGKKHIDFLKKYLKLKSGYIKLISKHSDDVFENSKIIGEHQGLPLYTIGQRKGIEIGGIGPFYVVKSDYLTNILYVTADRDDPVLYNDQLIVSAVNWISDDEPLFPLHCEAVIRYGHKPVKCTVHNYSHCHSLEFQTIHCVHGLKFEDCDEAKKESFRNWKLKKIHEGQIYVADKNSIFRSRAAAKDGQKFHPSQQSHCAGRIKCNVKCKDLNLKIPNYFVKLKTPQRAVAKGQSIVFYNKDEVLGGGIIMV